MNNQRINEGNLCLVVGGYEENIGATLTVVKRGVCTCGMPDWTLADASRVLMVGQLMGIFSIFTNCRGEDAGRYSFHESWLVPIKDKDGKTYGEEEEVRENAGPVTT